MTENTEKVKVSVVIATHNPRADYLRRTLEALRGQTMPREQWELVVVDNSSRVPLRAAGLKDKGTKGQKDGENCIDLSWHPEARIVREERLGLTFARLRGFAEAKGELIVMVDDDNLLAPDYLETAVRIAEERPMLGAFGGKCLAEFEVEPPEWLKGKPKGLGLRDRGDREEFFPEAAVAESWQLTVSVGLQQRARLADSAGSLQGRESGKPPTDHRQRRVVREFPDCAPIGAGMVLRRDAAAAYAERIQQRTTGPRDNGTITDRKGDSLASGGDNDICLTVVEEGWQVGYLPQLQLTHLIPARRMTASYHRRMAFESMQSFVLMLDKHGIRPWPAIPAWTVVPRIVREFLRHKPWKGDIESIRWWGSMGQCKAQAMLAGNDANS